MLPILVSWMVCSWTAAELACCRHCLSARDISSNADVVSLRLLKQCCLWISRPVESGGRGRGSIPKFFGVFCYTVFHITKWPASITVGLYARLLCLPSQAGEIKEAGGERGKSSGSHSSLHCLQFGHQSPFEFEFRQWIRVSAPCVVRWMCMCMGRKYSGMETPLQGAELMSEVN